MGINKKQTLEKLYAFRGMDKYATFGKAQTGIIHSPDDQQDVISNILDECCKHLAIEIESTTRPVKSSLKEIIVTHMDKIMQAPVNTENKDFGYHLCWFLAEKAGVDLWRNSNTKVWGYWSVDDNKVKTVTRVRKRKTA
ncbi:MAG: hypothetical protein BGO70_18300 [Bacteroidetes bacterium 43-93]|nr:hypothetical protein [Bacteroidota bacterium]OJX01684.1 MAG: hypothetical protein BGO70_18300 [Bacteroidetes bacterium 43-93]